ncbi:recombinase family protein [Pseudomonas gingeri]
MNAHLYLRASTKEQHADRAQSSLEAFAVEKGLSIVGTYSENVSGTKLNRPQLMRLLELAQSGDVLLVESVDRLSRLSQADWRVLRSTIDTKGLRLVVHDLPTSHMMVEDQGITGQIMKVINDMLIDLMATMARLDQEKRVERIEQGLARKRATENWTPPGKAKNAKTWEKVTKLLKEHSTMSADDVAKLAGCGVATVYRIKRELKAG